MVSHMEQTPSLTSPPSPAAAVGKIAQHVTSLLTRGGISQREASRRTGIPLTTLSRRLAGHSPLQLDELAALADLLDLSLVDLVSGADLETNPAA